MNMLPPACTEQPRANIGLPKRRSAARKNSDAEEDRRCMIGRVVDIPADHFGVDVPEMKYRWENEVLKGHITLERQYQTHQRACFCAV